jgi:RNAse (barnase) inhibitor barstar
VIFVFVSISKTFSPNQRVGADLNSLYPCLENNISLLKSFEYVSIGVSTRNMRRRTCFDRICLSWLRVNLNGVISDFWFELFPQPWRYICIHMRLRNLLGLSRCFQVRRHIKHGDSLLFLFSHCVWMLLLRNTPKARGSIFPFPPFHRDLRCGDHKKE